MNNNAKYAFYYLLSLVSLTFTALAVGMIFFGIIDKLVADALSQGDLQGQFKFAISAIFIAAPVFYAMMNLISKGLRSGDLSKDSEVRRWLTYFIILVSALTILGVLMGVINNFLSGALTLGFVLKMLVMLIIATSVLTYYFYNIKRSDFTISNKIEKSFFFGTAALVLVAFIAVWFFVDSPQLARNKNLDQKLINNIYSLESAVNSYYSDRKVLPDNLEQLKNDSNVFVDEESFLDPQTKIPLVYNKISTSSFEFCANFRTNSEKTNYNGPQEKRHKVGYQCLGGDLWELAMPTKF